jgi:hypothetical protein
LSANAGTAQVGLAWSASAGASSYNIKRSTTNGGPYLTLAAGVLTTNYTDAAITNGATYYYVVTASNPNGESSWSNQVAATVPLPSLSVTWAGAAVVLSWPGPASPLNLYSAANLAPPVAWFPVTNAVLTQTGACRVTLTPDSANRFFRLAP